VRVLDADAGGPAAEAVLVVDARRVGLFLDHCERGRKPLTRPSLLPGPPNADARPTKSLHVADRPPCLLKSKTLQRELGGRRQKNGRNGGEFELEQKSRFCAEIKTPLRESTWWHLRRGAHARVHAPL